MKFARGSITREKGHLAKRMEEGRERVKTRVLEHACLSSAAHTKAPRGDSRGAFEKSGGTYFRAGGTIIGLERRWQASSTRSGTKTAANDCLRLPRTFEVRKVSDGKNSQAVP